MIYIIIVNMYNIQSTAKNTGPWWPPDPSCIYRGGAPAEARSQNSRYKSQFPCSDEMKIFVNLGQTSGMKIHLISKYKHCQIVLDKFHSRCALIYSVTTLHLCSAHCSKAFVYCFAIFRSRLSQSEKKFAKIIQICFSCKLRLLE